MLVPKKERLAIYSFLFKEGVMVCKKEVIGKHDELEAPNLHVLKLMQSLKSRGYVREKFSWQWYYYALTNEGVEYLREYLHLPPNVTPATHERPAHQDKPRLGAIRGGRGGGRGGMDRREDREGYRGAKKMGAPEGFQPSYGTRGGMRGGFRGRGRGRGM